MNKMTRFLCLLALPVAVFAGAAFSESADDDAEFRDAAMHHGALTLESIKNHFYLPETHLDAEQLTSADQQERKASFAWSAGVQLSALTAAAHINRERYLADLRSYIDALDSYWIVAAGLGGYNCSAYPKAPDRFYDDNAWLVLGLVEAYHITNDPKDLRRARDAVRFVLSGQDDTLGGGIWWRENQKKSKNACSCAPGICAALRVFEITKEPALLKSATDIYKWTRSNLRDDDGLYFDSIGVDQKPARTKWTYNSALMIRAALLLYDQTTSVSYLQDAQQTAKAAVDKWMKRENGAIAGPACFSHLLAEALLELSARDHDPEWKAIDHAAVDFVWNHNRDAAGWHPERWDESEPQAIQKVKLIDQASAARAFFRAAWAEK